MGASIKLPGSPDAEPSDLKAAPESTSGTAVSVSITAASDAPSDGAAPAVEVVTAEAVPPPPKHQLTAAAAVVAPAPAAIAVTAHAGGDAAAAPAPAAPVPAAAVPVPAAPEAHPEAFSYGSAQLLARASFHAYNEGHSLPYVSYRDKPLRDTDFNRRHAACDWYELEAPLSSGSAGGGKEGEAPCVVVRRGGCSAVPPGCEPDWWWNQVKKGQKPAAPNPPPGEGYEEVAFVNCDKTDTQLWLHCNKAKKEIIVAFRGTCVTEGNYVDAFVDLDFKRIPLLSLDGKDPKAAAGGAAAPPAPPPQSLEAAEAGQAQPAPAAAPATAALVPATSPADDKRVHSGFFTAYARSVGANGLLDTLLDEVIISAEREEQLSREVSEAQKATRSVRQLALAFCDALGQLSATEGTDKGLVGLAGLVRKGIEGLAGMAGEVDKHAPEIIAFREAAEEALDGLDGATGGSVSGCGFRLGNRDRRRRVDAPAGLGSGWRVAVTGHSLGGALATLAAYDIANGQRKYGVSLYTYGAPRLGNAAFVQRFKERMTGLHEAFRVVFPDDRVPRVPDIKFGYCHTGKLYRFGKGNKLAADPEAQLREEKEARDNQPESQNFGTIAGYAAAKFFANAGDIMRSLIKRSLADDIKGPHCIYKDLLAPNA